MGGSDIGVLCINGINVAYISDIVTMLCRFLSDFMTIETIRRLDVNAVLLHTKSSKPLTKNKGDESVCVYILLSFVFNSEYKMSLN